MKLLPPLSLLPDRARSGPRLGAVALALVFVASLAPAAHAADPPTPPRVPEAQAEQADPSLEGPGRERRSLDEVQRTTATGATQLGNYGCHMTSGVHTYNPTDEVMRDIFGMAGFAPYEVGTRGDIDWTLDPYAHAAWRWGFHTVGWIGNLINDYRATGNPVLLNRAVEIARDWVEDNPLDTLTTQALEARAHRSHMLLCLYELVPEDEWLVSALQDHAQLLMAVYSGHWNHGLDESLALLGIGCELGDASLADYAVNRIGEMGDVVVDVEGATNEQAVGYQQYNYRRLVAAEQRLRDCGYALPEELKRRRDLMPTFLAHATKPDGTFTQIGDTEEVRGGSIPGTPMEYAASLGTAGTPPDSRVAIYSAGYVFGRDTWYPYRSAYHYSLRFGPVRAIHGHVDHMSPTYFARGRNILTEAGHVGYESGPRRSYNRGATGHNVLQILGLRESHVHTQLTRSYVSDRADFFEVVNDGYTGRRRHRSVLVVRNPQLMAVFDRVNSPTVQQFQQLWHLPKDMEATVLNRGGVTAVRPDGGTRIYVLQVPLPGQMLPPGSTQVVRGQMSPTIQGWVSPVAYEWSAAPTVTMTRAGTGTRHLTLIVPTRYAGKVSYGVTKGSDGWYRVAVTVAGVSTTLRVSPGGAMSVAG